VTGYFISVFVVTWGLWLAAESVTTPPVRTLLFYLGVFAPGIIALGMIYRKQGWAGVRELLARLVKADVGARWFAFALFFIATIKLLVALVVRVTTGDWPLFGTTPVPLMFAAAIGSTLLGGQVGEELGWRGYALPRLARIAGLGVASVILGIVWAAWHLPLFFITTADTVGQSFPFYLLQVTALSVAVAWLYMKTNGSLLATMLLHAAINNTKDIVPSALAIPGNPWALRATMVGWLTLAILWLCAAWFLVDMRRDRSVADLGPA
jgi:membrane protease YdiL (CAAX protease family)